MSPQGERFLAGHPDQSGAAARACADDPAFRATLAATADRVAAAHLLVAPVERALHPRADMDVSAGAAPGAPAGSDATAPAPPDAIASAGEAG